MKDYQRHFAKYGFPKLDKGAEPYLDKYWLDAEELNKVWLPKKHQTFNREFHKFPDRLFNENFALIIRKGGCLLYEDEYVKFQSCMRSIGEKAFVIVEDFNENKPPHTSGPPFRFKYPVDITWAEMTSGGEDSIVWPVFFAPIRMYFVFGGSGKWGMYAGNDYEWPLQIIGFDKRYSKLFHESFPIPEGDLEDLKQWTASYGMKLPGAE
jgi:hypothetical protein